MPDIFLALGSNLEKREENILNAIIAIKNAGIKIVAFSSFYETEPYGYKNQPNFVNVVIKTESDITPHNLLKTIKTIESDLGRLPSFKWGPRLIDIDILLYGEGIIRSEDLIIPHQELTKRDFFLIPTLEIDPEICDPLSKKPLKEYQYSVKSNIIKKFTVDQLCLCS